MGGQPGPVPGPDAARGSRGCAAGRGCSRPAPRRRPATARPGARPSRPPSRPCAQCAPVRPGARWDTCPVSPRARVRAPELKGRGWLNTGGRPYDLGDLRGRFVLVDFWAFCCVNCLHVLDELRPLEEKYAEELVVVGVHSPKFVHEADPDALAAAVERYEVHHPVLDDPDLVTWQAYTARAWPTLVLVDPEGYVVAQYAGEGHAHALDALLAELGAAAPRARDAAARRRRRTSRRRWSRATCGSRPRPCQLPGGTVLVADAGHHQLVELADDGEHRRTPHRVRRPRARRRRTRRSGGSASPTGCACCRARSPPRSGTTSSSPTPSTTRCAGSGSRTAGSPRWPAPASSCSPAPPTRRAA